MSQLQRRSSKGSSGSRTGRLAVLAALAAAVAFAPAARAQSSFSQGSLIIPTASSFQDACGMVSVYGLVYNILRANDGLAAYKVASSAYTTPIAVNWAFKETKSSPNRCVPTNLDKPRNGGSGVIAGTAFPVAPYNDVWNDGCDFYVDLTSAVPAKLVNNSSPAAANDTQIATIDTTDALGTALAYPNYYGRAFSFTAGSPNSSVSHVGYGGGAFVIDSVDAVAFLALVSGTAIAKDSDGNNIDFTIYRDKYGQGQYSAATKCDVSVDASGAAVFDDIAGGFGFSLASANFHHVNIHRAATSFTVSNARQLIERPPHIGLLQTVDHDFNDEGVGNPATGIKGTQLKFYLRSAGLDFTGAGGCPVGGYNVGFNGPTTTPSGGFPAAGPLCPNGGKHGQIYDILDVKDLVNGKIEEIDPVKQDLIYKVLWVPHWEMRTAGVGACSYAGCQVPALNKIAAYLTHKVGFMAECATIGTLEGGIKSAFATSSGNINQYDAANSGTQSLTCVASATDATKCDPTAFEYHGVMHDVSKQATVNPTVIAARLQNCTDPSAAAGSPCIHYGKPGDPFAQIGDYRWFTYSGGVANYFPNQTTSPIHKYKDGVSTLAYTVGSLDTAVIKTNPRSLAVADNFSFIQRDNDKEAAQLLYLGGHNYTADVAGTRVALNTMLALGLSLQTSPTGLVGPTLYSGKVFVPTYERIASAPSVAQSSFVASTGAQWLFPLHTGHLRAHNLGDLNFKTEGRSGGAATSVAGQNDFDKLVAMDAETSFPAPEARNLFTYMGGLVKTTGIPAGIPNGVAQNGWLPVDIDAASVGDSSSPSWVDKLHIGPVPQITVSGNIVRNAYAGMIKNTSASGVADLQEALQLTIVAGDLVTSSGVSDYGAAENTAILNKLKAQSEINEARWMLQLVRGHCFAVDPSNSGPFVTGPTNLTISAGSCSNAQQWLRQGKLGGFVHSQAAVIPASPFIPDLPAGTHRPTVAYVGGYDGQLHAFYVPSDGLDDGYTGPAATPTTLNTPASGIFRKSFNPFLASTAGLTELWSFIPPGQLPHLRDNSAKVDSSPAVIDVFGDFDGNGVRTWHTVLVASAGGSNRELFALDVTNPLAPSLVWDLASSSDVGAYAVTSLVDDDTGLSGNALAKSFLWQNKCRTADASCKAARFMLPPATDNGRSESGPFNYQHLGASQTVSVAALRRNNAPVFAAFVATNEPGGQGFYVFAIDVTTGQKLWEFNTPYDSGVLSATQFAGAGNDAPAGVSLLSKQGTSLIDTAYIGDSAGSLYEIDAADGLNLTGYANNLSTGCTDGGACNFALSEAFGDGTHSAQPISTLASVFIVPPSVSSTGLFGAYRNQTLIAYGTAGTDTINSITPIVSGAVHMFSESPSARYSGADVASATTKRDHAVAWGAEISEAPGFPLYLTGGERLYGSISAANDRLYFATTVQGVSNIDSRVNLTGSTYQLDLATATAANPLVALDSKAGGAGGAVLIDTSVAGTTTLITVTDQRIQGIKVTSTNSDASTVGANLNGAAQTPTGLLGWILRKTGREY